MQQRVQYVLALHFKQADTHVHYVGFSDLRQPRAAYVARRGGSDEGGLSSSRGYLGHMVCEHARGHDVAQVPELV